MNGHDSKDLGVAKEREEKLLKAVTALHRYNEKWFDQLPPHSRAGELSMKLRSKKVAVLSPIARLFAGVLIDACLAYLENDIVKWAKTLDGASARISERQNALAQSIDSASKAISDNRPESANVVFTSLSSTFRSLVQDLEAIATAQVNFIRRTEAFEAANGQIEQSLRELKLMQPDIDGLLEALNRVRVQHPKWGGRY